MRRGTDDAAACNQSTTAQSAQARVHLKLRCTYGKFQRKIHRNTPLVFSPNINPWESCPFSHADNLQLSETNAAGKKIMFVELV